MAGKVYWRDIMWYSRGLNSWNAISVLIILLRLKCTLTSAQIVILPVLLLIVHVTPLHYIQCFPSIFLYVLVVFYFYSRYNENFKNWKIKRYWRTKKGVMHNLCLLTVPAFITAHPVWEGEAQSEWKGFPAVDWKTLWICVVDL